MKEPKPQIDQQIREAMQKLHIDPNWAEGFSKEDLLYILDHCHFLQIVDSESDLLEVPPVELIHANSGWTIHYYGDGISSSPGKLLFGDHHDHHGKGTHRGQAQSTAIQMIAIAKDKGWSSIEIIDGSGLMKKMAMLEAKRLALPITGYELKPEDQRAAELYSMQPNELEHFRKQISPTSAT